MSAPWVTLWCLCVLLMAIAARGQADDPIESLEGMLIGDVQLEGITSDDNRQRAVNQINTSRGQPLNTTTVESDLRRLGRLGLFKSINAGARPLDDRRVLLVYTFVPNPIIQDVEVTGNERISTSEIAQHVDLLAGTPVDRFMLERTSRRIEKLYRDKGFYRVSVSVDWEYLDDTDIVLFNIDEGDRIKVSAIRFEGNKAFSTRLLRSEVKTKTRGLFEKAPLDLDQLDQDVASLIRFYRNRGHLDVRADRAPIRFSPDGREAIVTFLIDEGPRYTLRSIRAVLLGDDGRPSDQPPTVFSEAQLAGLMEIKAGDVFSARAVARSVVAVREAYERLGFVFDRGGTQRGDSSVGRRELRDPDSPQVDLLLVIVEGERYKVGVVDIVGAHLTQQKVPLRQVRVRPGFPVDGTALHKTERRLNAVNLFRPGSVRLTLQPPDQAEPEYRDLLIELEDTNTGQIGFGVLVNSDAGLSGFINIEQRNFDIADVPDSFDELISARAFRGAGQTLTIEASPGTAVQNFGISLTEPSLFETDYSARVGGSYRQREYRQYDEDRLSGSLGFGRRLGNRWNFGLSLRFEQVDIHDIDNDAPTDVYDVQGESDISGIGVSLTRTTRDSGIRPTRGARTTLGAEQIGALGGDYTFTKLSAGHSVIIPLREDFLGRTTTMTVKLRSEYIPADREDVPIYERYYLGGRSMRGFRNRTVSPKGIKNNTGLQGKDPIGGTFLFFAGAEVEHPILGDTMYGVLFVDSGTVTSSLGLQDYRVSAGFGLRMYITALSPAPLAFDFGFPILRQEGDEERVFSFSFDLPF